MNQRKFETRGRPRWTTAPPPQRRVSASARALSIGFDRHRPRARLQIPTNNLRERGLAAAVRPDQPTAISATELHGHIRKKGLGPFPHQLARKSLRGTGPAMACSIRRRQKTG